VGTRPVLHRAATNNLISGARRFIAREVETRIGRALLAGAARDGAVIRVDLVDRELDVRYENAPEA
jgi:ATP-dependent Clp protease ATP-binding subunit ClpB